MATIEAEQRSTRLFADDPTIEGLLKGVYALPDDAIGEVMRFIDTTIAAYRETRREE